MNRPNCFVQLLKTPAWLFALYVSPFVTCCVHAAPLSISWCLYMAFVPQVPFPCQWINCQATSNFSPNEFRSRPVSLPWNWHAPSTPALRGFGDSSDSSFAHHHAGPLRAQFLMAANVVSWWCGQPNNSTEAMRSCHMVQPSTRGSIDAQLPRKKWNQQKSPLDQNK